MLQHQKQLLICTMSYESPKTQKNLDNPNNLL